MLDVLDPEHVTADKGYVGSGCDTPYKNNVVRGGWRTGRYGITDSIGQIRYMVERVIANMKTWRILHTDCRAPKEKIVMVITVARKLLFFHAPE